ncbi:hypothetical protein C3747_121g59 [Trypanosoma cruzi]|uniref:Uncharacterized protein n=2 Tax=Trypanosoma cruzi TaxID=5693 RepID=Q4D5S9_TRYCC|nr:hypothetical protein, conserved [Trypanosoma cruzi]EAN87883.1 hypothetical protein, conserved [Trypanosoma cruzi]KAF5219951.1 hypothetical protein ECC02_007070 [Trypanosoma cruzi]KAF8301979.1 hypothetical protein TcYC6_0051960 [Trypanosoma cruzi]PWV06021.1 hypothetical protein C3747_121g59 [Trypanosoma cruzi]RNC53944.1 hypothetical protein TcCL_ESM08674 [Trypanosoma cruzi]|eukprot:XP_809734.1 hypothetical protein [Trypanosoma cruzi strain CL Brener]
MAHLFSSHDRHANHHLTLWGEDAQSALDETALNEAFMYRLRRMEAASRLTDEMMAQVRAIVDTEENPSYTRTTEEIAPSANDALRKPPKGGADAKLDAGRTMVLDGVTMPHSPEVVLQDEINRKVQKIQEMRIEQQSAAESQVKPTFQLVETSMELPAPPELFTSTSLAFALEALATSVSKIITATDKILVHLALLSRNNSPSVFKEMNVFLLYSKHAWRCYTSVLQHLKQHEVCAKALQDATFQELSSMREQFLVRKEMLTAQEQKLKVSEEHLRAMRLRLNNLDAQCRMWSGVLLNIPTPPLLVPSPTASRRISVTRERESPSLIRSLTNGSPSFAPRVSTVGNFPAQRKSSVRVYTPLVLQNIESLSSVSSTEEELESHLDNMEVKVARFWSNPYVMKAQQCAGRIWRQRHQAQRERTPTLIEVMGLPTPSRKESIHHLGSSLLIASDLNRLSVHGSLYKGGHTAEGVDKATAEARLMSLLRSLLRLASSVTGQTEATASSSTAKPEEGDDSMELRMENGGAPKVTNSIEDAGALAAQSVVVDAAGAMSESVRNLLKFLEESTVTTM